MNLRYNDGFIDELIGLNKFDESILLFFYDEI